MLGQMRHYVQLKKEERQSNGRGGWQPTEREIGFFWAAILPMTLRDLQAFRQLNMSSDTTIIMRWHPEIDLDCKVYYDGKVYDVEQVQGDYERSNFITLVCAGRRQSNG